MRTKKEIIKEIGEDTEPVTAGSVNDYLFLEVLVDIRDQQKKDAKSLRDTLKLIVKAIDRVGR